MKIVVPGLLSLCEIGGCFLAGLVFFFCLLSLLASIRTALSLFFFSVFRREDGNGW